MSLERSKFIAGVRGVHTNTFCGSTSQGAGEGGGGMLGDSGGVALRNSRFPTMRKLLTAAAAAELIKLKAVKRRAVHSKLSMVPITVDEFTRRGAAANNSNRSNKRHAVPQTEAVIRKTNVNERRLIPPRHQTLSIEAEKNWYCNGNSCSHKQPRGRRTQRTRTEQPQIICLLPPQRNFRQCSESSSEVSTSFSRGVKPNLSWSIVANARREQQYAEKQQREHQLPPQVFDQQKQKSELPSKRSEREVAEQKVMDRLQVNQQQQQLEDLAKAKSSHRSNIYCGLPKPAFINRGSSSSGSSSISSSSSSDTSSGSEHIHSVSSFLADGNTLKLTSTVIKILPTVSPVRAPVGGVAGKQAKATAAAPPASAPAPAATAASAAATAAVTAASTVTSKAATSYKQQQQQQQQQQPPQKLSKIAAEQKPEAQPPPLQKPTAETAAAAASFAHKIVRVDQHKVPKTIEDGVDISYQYFVSIPLARGKKPLPIRYLYRPMVRRLNQPGQSTATRRRSGSKKGTIGSKTDLEPEQQPAQSQQTEAPSSMANSEQETDHSEGLDGNEKSNFPLPPPVIVDAKYLPFIKQLKNHPMPEEPEQQQWADKQRRALLEYGKPLKSIKGGKQKQGKLENSVEEKPTHLQMLHQQHLQIKQERQLIEEQKKQLLEQQPTRASYQSARPILIDFKPNVTRLSCGIDSANICFHAPIRMCAGGLAKVTEGPTGSGILAEEAQLLAEATALAEAREKEKAAKLAAAEAAAAAAKEAEMAEAIANKAAATATAIKTAKIVATSDSAVIAAITYDDICPAKTVSFHLQGDSSSSSSNNNNGNNGNNDNDNDNDNNGNDNHGNDNNGNDNDNDNDNDNKNSNNNNRNDGEDDDDDERKSERKRRRKKARSKKSHI